MTTLLGNCASARVKAGSLYQMTSIHQLGEGTGYTGVIKIYYPFLSLPGCYYPIYFPRSGPLKNLQTSFVVYKKPCMEGRREARRWGYKLSALSLSTTCPLGRSETGARSGPNRGRVSSQQTGPPCEDRLGRGWLGPSPVERPGGCPPSRSLEQTHGQISELNG